MNEQTNKKVSENQNVSNVLWGQLSIYKFGSFYTYIPG